MLSNRSHALVGERCPVLAITRRLLIRNIQRHFFQRPTEVRAGYGRTVQERTGAVDTWLTQRNELLFGKRSVERLGGK